MDVLGRARQQVVCNENYWAKRCQAVVTICFNEVMPGNGKRVNVVLSEGTNKILERGRKESLRLSKYMYPQPRARGTCNHEENFSMVVRYKK